MGTFKEDSEIRVSEIVKLWAAEGFLKPNGEQILEEMAEDYLKDLMDRNLILVCEHRKNGKVGSFRIHDLLRELCLRVADKEEFFCVVKADSIPQGIERERRLISHYWTSSYDKNEFFNALQSGSLARSLICSLAEEPVKCKLLRVLHSAFGLSLDAVFQNVNLRHIVCDFPTLSSSISLMWNLQTLVIVGADHPIVAPSEIWKMSQLRHLNFAEMLLPDPAPSNDKDDFVILGNLQTLTTVWDFRMSEEVCKRIPNIKKLGLLYSKFSQRYDNSFFDNIGGLQKLESLYVVFPENISISKLKYTLPTSLKKLFLEGRFGCYEDFWTVTGSLPQLEVLEVVAFSGSQHKLSFVEGGFLRLKYLSIEDPSLESWIVDGASCFPVLEKLVLSRIHKLNEMSSSIGEISTLQLIRLEFCIESLVNSAMKIKKEQEDFGNYGLQIQVSSFWEFDAEDFDAEDFEYIY